MIILLNKFGTTLISRPSGKEAWLAFQPSLNTVSENEEIIVDFTNVAVLTPSWADEFLTPLFERYNGRVKLQNTSNPTVTETLIILQRNK
jgi:hypothetical protein